MSGPNEGVLTGAGNPPAGGEGGGQDTPEAKAAAEAAAKAAADKEAADVAKAQEGMTDEQKAADNKARADKKEADKKAADAAKAKAAEGAPETYAEFKMPEGIEADKATVEKFGALAKELNLSQEKAQKLVDIQTGFMKEQAEQQAKAWEKVLGDWEKQGQDDPFVGGKDYEANKGLANAVIAKFGLSKIMVDGKETQSIKPLVDALSITGAGNHPEILRLLVNVGKAIGEDKLRGGTSQNTPEPRTLAQRIFSTVDPPAS